jgi:hypothetical protein
MNEIVFVDNELIVISSSLFGIFKIISLPFKENKLNG